MSFAIPMLIVFASVFDPHPIFNTSAFVPMFMIVLPPYCGTTPFKLLQYNTPFIVSPDFETAYDSTYDWTFALTAYGTNRVDKELSINDCTCVELCNPEMLDDIALFIYAVVENGTSAVEIDEETCELFCRSDIALFKFNSADVEYWAIAEAIADDTCKLVCPPVTPDT